MADLMDAAEKIREHMHCAVCDRPVDKVHPETDPVLLRHRFVIECHGKVDFVHSRDPRFALTRAIGQGHFAASTITVFQARGA